MPMPKSVVKFSKGGFTFEDSVDRTQYTIKELVRAANRDVGKYICREARQKLPRRTGRGRRAIQYWNRKDGTLEVGIKRAMPGNKIAGFYAAFFERGEPGKGPGSHSVPALRMLHDTTQNNVDQIRMIQGQYLSAVEDDNRAVGLIDEDEEISDDE